MNEDYNRRLEHQLYLAKENPEPIYDVSKCNLSTIPQGCFSLCKVLRKKKLYLNNNHIRELNSNGNKLEDLTVLTELYLESNEITKLPDAICCVQYLQILDISNNKLTVLPSSISNLAYLRELNVKDNNLNGLPTSLFKPNSNLELIDIRGNSNFNFIPIEITNLLKLRKFDCTTKYLRMPSQDICEKGMVEIIKVLCKINGIDVNKSFIERISGKEDVSSDIVDSSTLDYEKYKQSRMNFLKSIEDEYDQVFLYQKSLANKALKDRMAFITTLAEEEAKIMNEIGKMQRNRDRYRQQLIDNIKAAEKDAANLIEEIITISKTCQRQERILDEIENETMKKYQLYQISKVESEQLRRQEILNAMSQMLISQDITKDILSGLNFKRESLKHSLSMSDSRNQKALSAIIHERQSKRNQIISKIENEENNQKLAFQHLQIHKDIRTLRLTEHIYSIESELIVLSKAEQRKRAEKVDFKFNILNERRQQLVEMLENLIRQKELRERVLYQRMNEMEEQRQKDQDDFWLIQYQRCLDMKPHCFWDTNNGLERPVMELLNRVNATEYFPFFLKFKITWNQVEHFQEKDWGELGIYNKSLLKTLQETVKEMKKEEENKLQDKSGPTILKNSDEKRETGQSMFITCQRETECCICLNEETTILFMPCGHISCCERCSKDLKECPLCRSEISRIIKLMCW